MSDALDPSAVALLMGENGEAPAVMAGDVEPHEYEPVSGVDGSCAHCGLPAHEPVVDDPIDRLNQLASHSVASSRVLANLIHMTQQPPGAVPYADFIPIGGLLNERAAVFAQLWDMLKEDGRLPEGVRVMMAELTFALQAIACVVGEWRPQVVIANPEAVDAARQGPQDRAARRREQRGR